MIVALVERKPRHRPSIDCNSRQPVSEQRCLAEAGRRSDERQLRLGPSVQPVAQSRARHKTTPPLGNVKLGLEQRRNHERLRYEPTTSRILGGPSPTPEPDVEQIRLGGQSTGP